MKKLICLLLLAFLLVIPVSAEGVTEIHTPEDLAAMAENPAGEYILMSDLDMEGVEWNCFDFSGTLDGNGHSILNLTITEPGSTTDTTLDGNQIEYETWFAGMFSRLDHAEIRNLNLLNVRMLVETDVPCFAGAVAGFSDDAVITDCRISGTLELRAHDRMFGLAGVLGYGTGTIENSEIDVTLICVDTDAQTRDEQFLGGAFGTGFMTVADSIIRIDGYISEHGYVHSGGVAGMLMQYPIGMHRDSRIIRNEITGKITFFEDNTNRRAYCESTVGEQLLVFNYGILDNVRDFTRDERFEYDAELRPEMCENPVYQEKTVPGTCDAAGFTEYTCTVCGYVSRDHFTVPQHRVSNWQVLVAPEVGSTGLSSGVCDDCGAMVQREEEPLPPPTEPPTEPDEGKPAEPEVDAFQPKEHSDADKTNLMKLVVPALIAAVCFAVIAVVLILKNRH